MGVDWSVEVAGDWRVEGAAVDCTVEDELDWRVEGAAVEGTLDWRVETAVDSMSESGVDCTGEGTTPTVL